MNKPVTLSASRIELFQTCSYKYYCNYVLKLPQKSNDGAKRGTICHLVFELLTDKRHKKHFDKITKEKTILASSAIHRLVLKNAKKVGINTQENISMISDMILVGLHHDFFCKGASSVFSEDKFTFETEKYTITGFIDKLAIFDTGDIEITDYKSSKKKYDEKKMDGNLQTLMYSLVTFKKRGKIPRVKFMFLRFPDSPMVHADKCTPEELQGFESYLVYLTNYLTNFNLSKATANYAAEDVDKKWLCGFAKYPGQQTKNGKEMWCCDYKFPFDYYSLVNEETGEPIAGAFDIKDLNKKPGTKIIYRRYNGCPVFGNKLTRKFPDATPSF